MPDLRRHEVPSLLGNPPPLLGKPMHLPMCYTCNSSNRTREARTPDLLRVKQALSQLSYGSVYLPMEPGRFELPTSCSQGRRSPG